MGHMSILDPDGELPVDDSTWVIGIFRKPQGNNPEHAFILVEGSLPGGDVLFRRYELFINNEEPTLYQIHADDKSAPPLKASNLLITEILNSEEVTGKCWSISKAKAKELHNTILDEIKNPGKYNLLGDVASLPKTMGASHTVGSSSHSAVKVNVATPTEESFSGKVGQTSEQLFKPSGHNCFTWARKVLYSLDIPEIKNNLPRQAEELFASVTSRHLKQENEPESRCLTM